ncbi:MAG: hypothetical protein AB7V58_00075 [Solirubrobacterales bacterium]
MKAALRQIRSRRVLWALGLAGALVLLASPAAHADIWANIGPASELGGLKSRYPLGNYEIDEHFTAISAGVFSGVDVSGLLPMIAYFFANLAWQGTAWLANILIELFAFAFSLDLVNGSGATNGAGALGPVSRAIHSIYATAFGGPWMVLAVSVAGLWAMWKALVQRRYSETAGQLALSLIYITLALFFVWQPAQTIGVASQWTNTISGAFLSIAKNGEPGSQQAAKQAGADQLFGLLVAEPWAVLQFGGLEHCVKTGSGSGDAEPTSVPVQPLPADAARELEAGGEVSAAGKTCVNNLKRYGDHFLRFAPGSDERDDEFDALQHGDSSKLPDADPSKARGDYKLSAADEPAAAAMEEGGQYQRLLIAIVVFCAELGAFCLLGALSVGVITAQVLLLLLLAFSPVALVAAAIPGRGHQFFKAWLSKLGTYLLRKAAYSLILAILLAVCAAIAAATSRLGWLMSFGLQCAFFWAVFLQRRSLTDGLVGIVTGPGAPGRERALSVLALYYGARGGAQTLGGPAGAAGRGAGRTFGWAGRRLLGSRGRSGEPVAPWRVKRVPLGGMRYRKDLGREAEGAEAAGRTGGSDAGRRAGRRGENRSQDRRPREDEPERGEPGRRAEAGETKPRRDTEGRETRRAGASGDPERRSAGGGVEEGTSSQRSERDRSVAPAQRTRTPPVRKGSARAAGAPGTPPPQAGKERGLADELRAEAERARTRAAARRSPGSGASPPEREPREQKSDPTPPRKAPRPDKRGGGQ